VPVKKRSRGSVRFHGREFLGAGSIRGTHSKTPLTGVRWTSTRRSLAWTASSKLQRNRSSPRLLPLGRLHQGSRRALACVSDESLFLALPGTRSGQRGRVSVRYDESRPGDRGVSRQGTGISRYYDEEGGTGCERRYPPCLRGGELASGRLSHIEFEDRSYDAPPRAGEGQIRVYCSPVRRATIAGRVAIIARWTPGCSWSVHRTRGHRRIVNSSRRAGIRDPNLRQVLSWGRRGYARERSSRFRKSSSPRRNSARTAPPVSKTGRFRAAPGSPPRSSGPWSPAFRWEVTSNGSPSFASGSDMATNYPSAGYILSHGEGRRTWLLGGLYTWKATGKETGNRWALMEGRNPRGGGPPLHVHERDAEGIYLLEGEISFWLGDEQHRASPGSFVLIPPGVPHRFTVESFEARHLTVIVPGDLVRLYDMLGEPTESEELPPPDAKKPGREELEEGAKSAKLRFLAGAEGSRKPR
jgi:quercetin dioxygenase-like cupin family protein